MRGWGLLCLALILLPVGSPAQSKKSRSKKSVSQLKRELAGVRRKREEVRKHLRTTKRVAKAVLADIHRVDGELVDLEGKLEATTQRLSTSRAQQKVVAGELRVATAKLDATREMVRKRIKRMYMQGDSNMLTVMVGDGDVGEIASRDFVFQRIAEQDKRVFQTYTELQSQVKSKKREADDLVHRVLALQQEQTDQQGSLKDARRRKGAYFGELKSKQGELQEMLDQFQEDEATIGAQIRAYQRRTSGRKGSSPPPYRGGAFSYPVNGRITSNFGMRYHPILHITRMHSGLDFGAPVGTHIHAAAPGVVIHSGYMRGYGNVVILDHGGGLSTVYAHCSRIIVSSGQKVSRGQYIANVGSTGLSTGPHLHFEVRVNGRAVNPRNYL